MTLTTYLRTLKSIRQWLSDIVRDIRVEAEHCNPVRKAIYIYIYISTMALSFLRNFHPANFINYKNDQTREEQKEQNS